MKTIIIIPSRLSATRLPGKPLLKINGLSIISHVFKRAEKANIGDVFVAAEDQEIVDDVKKNGGQAILTSKQNKLREEMDKISVRLENKSFLDNAPKEIVEQEKINYNNFKKDIDKISLTIKGM